MSLNNYCWKILLSLLPVYLDRETVAVLNTSVQEDAVIGTFIGKMKIGQMCTCKREIHAIFTICILTV
jgi:hypothetical protein